MHNFGKNVSYEPRHQYTPRTEEEVLGILARHRGGRIRVQGAGHSWSRIVEATDVLVNLALFSGVAVEPVTGGHVARVGAGATIEKVLAALRETPFSLPTLGAITRQTIGGATATATHGTGNASLSSFVRSVKLACYDASGNPIIKTVHGGDELLAVRASLGCLGVILELTIDLVPRFWMDECMKAHDSLDRACLGDRLASAAVPGLSVRLALVRLPSPTSARAGRTRTPAPALGPGLRRDRRRVGDAHARQGSARSRQAVWSKHRYGVLEQALPPLMLSMPVSGSSETILTLHTRHHHVYRHVEMELFVPKPHLMAAAAFLQEAIPFFAGSTTAVSATLIGDLTRAGVLDEFAALQNQCAHHYLIFFRRVLGEDTFLAMNEGRERYSISLFTFEPERRRKPYYAVCRLLARAFARLYSARPHWGKYNPLTAGEIAPLYPKLARFREISARTIRMACFRTTTRRHSPGHRSITVDNLRG